MEWKRQIKSLIACICGQTAACGKTSVKKLIQRHYGIPGLHFAGKKKRNRQV